MRRILIWLTLCVLLIASQAVHAQSSPQAWPITQQCVGTATKPPKDWHFDGTLLLSGSSPLHVYREGWATPRILVFDANFGRLSPDNHWYAAIESEISVTTLITTFHIHAITVYSTQNDEKYTIPWENEYSAIHSVYGHGLYWLDNQHLLYSKGDTKEEWYVIDPFTQTITQWQGKFVPSGENDELSPNVSLMYSNGSVELGDVLTDGESSVNLPTKAFAGWSPDSSHFAAYTVSSDPFAVDNLAIYNREGKQVDTVFHFSNHAHFFPDSDRTWSPDGRYLLFAADHLYIADMNKKSVIDTCIPVEYLSIAWSPSSKQFAMVERHDSKRQVQIFDLDAWARYIVTYHSGSVIGWSADD